ncbi:hypothetical protein CsSME_00032795 [Camellia sinensis var. sinensis]
MLKSIPASGLLRKLWWSTLGLQFDWSKFCEIHSSVISEEFRPEAVIVNYFNQGKQSSYQDDVELGKELVLFS